MVMAARDTQVKQGYKKTEVGVIPEHWEVKTLGDLCTSIVDGTHFTPKYVSEGVPFYSVENVTANNFSSTKFISLEEHNRLIQRCKPEKGDILLTRIGSLGDTKLIDWDVNASIYVSLALLKVDQSSILPEYLYAYSKSSQFVRDVERRSLINAAPKKINMGEIGGIPVPLPSFHEQRGIAKILATWDHAIHLAGQVVAVKKKRKRGLTQQLLTGRRRLNSFARTDEKQHTQVGPIPSDWNYISISEIARQISERNTIGRNLPVLSCTKYEGLVDSLTYFGRQIFSEDTSTYKVVQRHQFAYATNHIEEGSIGYQDLDDEALISPMYTVFETGPGVNDRFLYALLKTETYRRIFERSTSASVDRRGSLRWNQFSAIKVPLPSLTEQGAIADVLDTCDQEIALLNRKLALFKRQKQGLMQQLLTGKVRVTA